MNKIYHPKVNAQSIGSTNLCQPYELTDPAYKMNRNRIFNLDIIKNYNPRDNIYDELDKQQNATNRKVKISGMEKTLMKMELQDSTMKQLKVDKATA